MSTDNYEVLKYRVEQLENMMKPLIEAFNNLDKKVGLLSQKIVIATFIVGSVFQGFGVWYSVHGDKKYTEGEKITYYESRISNSERIKSLQAEIDRLMKVEGAKK